MRVLMINSVCGIGSTGRICTDLAQEMEAKGHAYGRSDTVPEKFRKYAAEDARLMGICRASSWLKK